MKLKKTELTAAVVNFMCVKLFISAPGCFNDMAKNAAWIAVVINSAAAFASFFIIYYFYKKSGRRDIFSCLPPWLRKIFGLITALYFIVTSGISLALLIRSVIRSFMPETPSFLISLLFAAAIIYASRKGIEANTRISVLVAPILLIIAAVAVALIPNMEATNLYPLFGSNDFYLVSCFGFNFFSDFIAFYLLAPYLEKKEDALKTGCITLGISTALCLTAVISSTLTMPYEAKFASPFYQMLTFMAGSSGFVSAIKVFKLAFLINFFLYLSSSAAYAVYALEKSFDFKYSNELSWIVTILMITVEEMQFRTLTLPEVYKEIMGKTFIVFPLLPLAAYLLGGRKKREKNLCSLADSDGAD